MKKTKAKLILQGERAEEDMKLVEEANFHEMDVMPVLRLIGALRFLQDLSNDTNKTIHEITPETVIDAVKNQPKFTFDEF